MDLHYNDSTLNLMCCFSGSVSFHCQNVFFSMCSSFNSLCVKFVVHEEHNVVLFQPSEKEPPQKPMTALNKPAKRPSLLPLTRQTPLKQLLSRAAVTYRVILLPMNLLPILCSPSGQDSGCTSHTGHAGNAAEPICSRQRPARRSPRSSERTRRLLWLN